MVTTEGKNAAFSSGIPRAGPEGEPAQSCGDLIIRELARHLANDLDRLKD